MRVKIHLYTVCWNEEVILPHFLRHYDFVDRIVVYDNQSDDRSVDLLKAVPKVEVRLLDTGGKHHTGKLDQVRNHAWKESKGQADFVLVCDMDEFLYHPDLLALLELMKTSGATVLKPQGYEMLGSRPPEADENVRGLYPTGVRTYSFDKCVLFDPNAIDEIAYQPGSHVCEPKGRVQVFRRPQCNLLHYRHLGLDYVRQRYEACAVRRSDFNRERHLGVHYLEQEEATRRRFEKLEQVAEQVFSNENSSLQLPENFEAAMNLAQQAGVDKDWKEAIKQLEYILSYQPVYLSALTKLSEALLAEGRSMDAGYVLKQAVALEPEQVDLWFNLGKVAASLNSEKVAINSYQRVLKLKPEHDLAYLGLANVYKSAGQASEAAKCYRRVIEINPRASEAYRQWGGMAYQLKRYDRALKLAQAWMRWDDANASAFNACALALKALGREGEAIEKLRLALELDPASLAVLNNMGTLMQIRGDLDEAASYFRRALQQDAGNAVLKTHLANVLFDLGQYKEAKRWNPTLVIERQNGA